METTAHPSRYWMLALALASWLAVPLACWIIPVRLATSEFSNYYTFGYVGDEYLYAQRMQPLLEGASKTNPLNGIGEPGLWSPFYLEDLCRVMMDVTGADAPAFFWAWRFIFPFALAGAFLILVRSSLPARRGAWNAPLALAAAGAAIGYIFLMYELCTPYPPMHGWIQRVPTNCEYFLGALVAAAYVALLRRPNMRHAALLALAGAALFYLRIYAALPWVAAASIGVLALLVTRRIPLRSLLLLVALFVALLIPWILAQKANSSSVAFQETITRFFILPGPGQRRPYEIHPEWPVMVSIAAAMALAAIPLRRRILALSCAAVLLALPFVAGLTPMAYELISYNRFGVFYLIASAAVLLAALRQMLAARPTRRPAALRILAAGGIGAGLLVTVQYARADFLQYPKTNLESVVAEQIYLPAYRWAAENTPPGALFLVDDGCDWGSVPRDVAGFSDTWSSMHAVDDVFGLVARRRRGYALRMYMQCMRDAELEALRVLHVGTFGFPVPSGEYTAALKQFRPQYILWRKTPALPVFDRPAPVPRGFGIQWKELSRVVYSDDACEIWRLDYGQNP